MGRQTKTEGLVYRLSNLVHGSHHGDDDALEVSLDGNRWGQPNGTTRRIQLAVETVRVVGRYLDLPPCRHEILMPARDVARHAHLLTSVFTPSIDRNLPSARTPGTSR